MFNINDEVISEIKFTTLSHNLSILDIIQMNQIISKRKLSITFLGIVVDNVEYGEEINQKLLKKLDFIEDLIKKYCMNIEIKGIY